jgi:TIGR03009 family protein
LIASLVLGIWIFHFGGWDPLSAQSPPAGPVPSVADRGSPPPSERQEIQLQNPIPIGPPQTPLESQAETQAESQAPFRLTLQEQEQMGRLLEYWQTQNARVQTFSCRFTRYTYDNVFGPPSDPKLIAEGVVRYAAPDKGEFQVTRLAEFTPPAEPGKRPTYPWKKEAELEHWLCDGNSVFQLDNKTKTLIELRLPPELRGKDIADGPVPFIFGANRSKIEARYWLREVLPQTQPAPDRKQEFCLEAYPRRRNDAGNFQRVMLILDGRTFLPKAMQVFPPAYDGKTNLSREVYTFTAHHVNTVDQRARQFLDQFISPKLPSGWKKVVDNFGGGEPEQVPQAAQRDRPSAANAR